jgi:gliding motility-associated lipoprotein GldH
MSPGDTVQKIQYELPLANKDKWLGTAMGDVYEHRVLLTPHPIYFKRSGEYIYKIEQVMREDPLPHVLNVGLRIEKKSL